MTIYEIKERTLQTSPHFFDHKTLRFFGQTMKSFHVYKLNNGTFLLTAPIYHEGKYIGETRRIFNPQTNKLERE